NSKACPRFLTRSLSTWFTSEYKKSGKKLDMGKGCVRFKSLGDLALDTRGSASGSGTRQRTRVSYAKREVGAACALLLVQRRSRDNRLVGGTVARVPMEEHMFRIRDQIVSVSGSGWDQK